MRYSINKGLDSLKDEGSEPIIIITEEGMLGSIYHNGNCIEALLWRGYRADKYEFTDDFWDNLSEMPSEVHTFGGSTAVTKEILDWCVFRLCMFCPTYDFCDWDELVSDYNSGRVLTDTFDDILDGYLLGNEDSAKGLYGKLTDAEKDYFLLYVETLKHYEVEIGEDMQKQLFKLLTYLNQ
jgi:hypothetical protein